MRIAIYIACDHAISSLRDRSDRLTSVLMQWVWLDHDRHHGPRWYGLKIRLLYLDIDLSFIAN